MRIDDCTYDNAAAGMLEILNDAILNTTALYEYEPRSAADLQRWFADKTAGGWPVFGAFDEQGALLGFASYGPFRHYPANRFTVEHSVYVHPAQRGRGVGGRLLERLIEQAARQRLHVMVGCIDADNHGSIRLHQRLGFRHAGTLRQVGFKFGRWLDLALYQRLLEPPAD